jgi:hypothetical protein
MSQTEQDELIDLLKQMRFRAPVTDLATRSSSGRSASHRRFSFALVAVAAVLLVVGTAGVAGAATNWFGIFQPRGCETTAKTPCGADFTQMGLVDDHPDRVAMVNALVQPGLSNERLKTIASSVADEQQEPRVIVYLFKDLPQGTMEAAFPNAPASGEVAPDCLPSLTRYWVYTYDRSPTGIAVDQP